MEPGAGDAGPHIIEDALLYTDPNRSRDVIDHYSTSILSEEDHDHTFTALATRIEVDTTEADQPAWAELTAQESFAHSLPLTPLPSHIAQNGAGQTLAQPLSVESDTVSTYLRRPLTSYHSVEAQQYHKYLSPATSIADSDSIRAVHSRGAGEACCGVQRPRWCMRICTLGDIPLLWIFLVLLGFTCAAVGYAIDESVNSLHAVQGDLTGVYWNAVELSDTDGDRDSGIAHPSGLLSMLLWWTFGLLLGVLSMALVALVSPQASGSGIPEMKAYLSGSDSHMTGFLSSRTLVVKVIGLICAQGSGLSVGKEGPLVHVAGAITDRLLHLPWFIELRSSPALRRQLIAAAVAAGVTMAFGTPVGGVIFSLEVTATYFRVSSLWRAFLCSICCIVALRLFNSFSTVAIFNDTQFQRFQLGWELLAYALLGALSGITGGLFVKCVAISIRVMTHWTERGPESWSCLRTRCRGASSSLPARLALPFLVLFACVWCSYAVQYLRDTDSNTINAMFREGSRAAPGMDAHWSSHRTAWHLLWYLCLKFPLTVFSVAMPVPAGVFSPAFAMGAVGGRLFGELLELIGPSAAFVPGTYALVGAAAFAAGVTRTLSTAIIVFEITGQVTLLVPVLVAVLVSYSVSSAVSQSVYDVAIYMKDLPYLAAMPATLRLDSTIRSKRVMSPVPWIPFVSDGMTFAQLRLLLRREDLQSFSLVAWVSSDGVLLGSFLRSSLVSFLYYHEGAIWQNLSADEATVLADHIEEVDSMADRALAEAEKRRAREGGDRIDRPHRRRAERPEATPTSFERLMNLCCPEERRGRRVFRGLGRFRTQHRYEPVATASSGASTEAAADALTINDDSSDGEGDEDQPQIQQERAKPHLYEQSDVEARELTDRYDRHMGLVLPLRSMKPNTAPLTFRDSTRLSRMRFIFAMLNLPQAFVCSANGVLLGAVTQESLLEADGSSSGHSTTPSRVSEHPETPPRAQQGTRAPSRPPVSSDVPVEQSLKNLKELL